MDGFTGFLKTAGNQVPNPAALTGSGLRTAAHQGANPAIAERLLSPASAAAHQGACPATRLRAGTLMPFTDDDDVEGNGTPASSPSLRGGGKRPCGEPSGMDVSARRITSEVMAWQAAHNGCLPQSRENKRLYTAWRLVVADEGRDTWAQSLRDAVQHCVDTGAAAERRKKWTTCVEQVQRWQAEHDGRLPRRRDGDDFRHEPGREEALREEALAQRWRRWVDAADVDGKAGAEEAAWQQELRHAVQRCLDASALAEKSLAFADCLAEVQRWQAEHDGRLPRRRDGDDFQHEAGREEALRENALADRWRKLKNAAREGGGLPEHMCEDVGAACELGRCSAEALGFKRREVNTATMYGLIAEVQGWSVAHGGILPRRAHRRRAASVVSRAVEEERHEERYAQLLSRWRASLQKGEVWETDLLVKLETDLPAFWGQVRRYVVAGEIQRLLGERRVGDAEVEEEGETSDVGGAVDFDVLADIGKACSAAASEKATPELRAAVFACGVEFITRAMAMQGRVDGAIFIAIRSDPEVRKHAKSADVGLGEELASIARRELWFGVADFFVDDSDVEAPVVDKGAERRGPGGAVRTGAVKFDASFFEETNGLASLDVRTLCRLAAGSSGAVCRRAGRTEAAGKWTTAQERLRAINMLSKHFPAEYGEIAKDLGCDAGSVGSFWAGRRQEAMMEGAVKRLTVCCRTSVQVRVPLRFDGRPETFVNPVLPVFENDGQDIWLRQASLEHRRQEHCGGHGRHGSSLFWLAADFLCVCCQSSFLGEPGPQGVVRSFGDEEVDLWWGRLFPNTTPRAETDKRRMAVEAAHEAFKQREEMLRLAVAGVAAETAIQAAQRYWKEFKEIAASGAVMRSAVEGPLSRHQLRAVPPVVFIQSPEAGGVRSTPWHFGVQHGVHESGRHWLAEALPKAVSPASWSDYTGATEAVSAELWCLRAWARAAGGWERLGKPVQGVLQHAEGIQNADYRCVAYRGEWRFALQVMPGGLPAYNIWYELERELSAAGKTVDVGEVREAIETERETCGVKWSEGVWEVDTEIVLKRAGVMGSLRNETERQVLRHCEQQAEWPRVALLGQGGNDWGSKERRSEHNLSQKAQRIALRLARCLIWSWSQRSSQDWEELAAKNKAPADSGLASVASGAGGLVEDGRDTCVEAGDGYGSVVGAEATWVEEADDDKSMPKGSSSSSDADGIADDVRDVRDVLAGGARGRAGARAPDVEETDRLRGVVRDVLQKVIPEHRNPNIDLDAMSMGEFLRTVRDEAGVSAPHARKMRWRQKVADLAAEELPGTLSAQVRLKGDGDAVPELNNEELRRLVQGILRGRDLRSDSEVTPAVVRQALVSALHLTAGALDEDALPRHGFNVLVQEEWLRLWELAWPLFLFDDSSDGKLDIGLCQARVWVVNASAPVFAQCRHTRKGETLFCQKHSRTPVAELTHGVWDPSHHHASLCAKKRAEGVREAKKRAMMRQGEPGAGVDAASVALPNQGFNAPKVFGRWLGKAAAERPLRAPVRQKPFYAPAYDQNEGLRVFDSRPLALPPFPCRLCRSANFATRERLETHCEAEHGGWDEYRKVVFYLEQQRPTPVTAQVWRLSVGHFVEELITGSEVWPECLDVDGQEPRTEQPVLPRDDCDASRGMEAVAIDSSTCAEPAAEAFPAAVAMANAAPGTEAEMRSAFEERGAERVAAAVVDDRRAVVRHRKACAVCARLDWHNNLREVLFWRQAARSETRSFICDDAGSGSVSPREAAHVLLSPERYHRRWRFAGADGREGGIPLAELEASCVREPGRHGRLWLLHRKVFRIVVDEKTGEEVADRDQWVPVCEDCHTALTGLRPRMPKFALANDLWMGAMPAPLRSLSVGSWMLLPLGRAAIRRYNCSNDAGTWRPADQRIKGFVGNVCTFPQADGGKLATSLPPSSKDVSEHILIAFTGTDQDLKKARLEGLGVEPERFKAAYDFLKAHNVLYANTRWDEEAAKDLEMDEGHLGLPKVLARCLRRQEPDETDEGGRVRQHGPADAVDASGWHADAGGQGEEGVAAGHDEVEEDEFCAGIADDDMKTDADKQIVRIQLHLQRLELLQARSMQHEVSVRESHLAMKEYLDQAGREEIEKEKKRLEQSLAKLDVDKMEMDLQAAVRAAQQTQPPPGLRGPGGAGAPQASAAFTEGGRRVLLVPTGGKPLSMFESKFWSAVDPRSFPYGDGVFGIDREEKLTFSEWVNMLLCREELVYKSVTDEAPACVQDSVSDGAAGRMAGASRDEDPLPRWRSGRDLLTMCYCLSRRMAYISSARLFVKRKCYQRAVKDVGSLTPADMRQACAVAGDGAGLKEALQNPEVPERVKAAMRHLLLCMSNVVGSNAHRTTLRHMCSGYRLLYGAPLVFTTMNVADTKHPLMCLLYEGQEMARWRLLEEDEPNLPNNTEMLRRVARDPVSQAIFSHLMLDLFCRHMLGVDSGRKRGFCDSMASSTQPGIFGPVQAYFGPLETQGRGGLHAHMCVWVRYWMRSPVLDKLRSGTCDDVELEKRLVEWRSDVLKKVGTMQFDSVEEVGRQVGLKGPDALLPLPMSEARRQRTFMDGRPEEEDFCIKPPPESGGKDGKTRGEDSTPWRVNAAQGPVRQRPLVALQSEPAVIRNPCSAMPGYRRLPSYRSLPADARGEAEVVGLGDVLEESVMYARHFGKDARQCYIQSHVHRCMNTCWKYRGGGKTGDVVRLCRFGFYHIHEVLWYPRLRPAKKCQRPDCCLKANVSVHPSHCPPLPPQGEVRKFHRHGKALVLPRDDDHAPRVCVDDRFGRAGKVQVLRYHPDCGSSHPALQVACRCNFDVQCTDRVPVVAVQTMVTRWKRKRKAPRLWGGAGGGCSLDDPDGEALEEPDDSDGDAMQSTRGREEEPPDEDPRVQGDCELEAEDEGWDRVEEIHERFLDPASEASSKELPQGALRAALVEACLRMFRDATNQSHYQGDYATKANPSMGGELPEQAIGIERLREDEEENRKVAEKGGRDTMDAFVRESCRRTLIRLETSANRTTLKKASEMASQLVFGHECYKSHETWTVFCKSLVWVAYRASRRMQELRRGSLRGQVEREDYDDDLQPDWPGVNAEDGGTQVEAAPEELGGLRAGLCGEGERIEGETDLRMIATTEQSQRQDWLHRGRREPLASMGLYHYAMFVYTAHVSAATVPPDDFETYLFAESHPSAMHRVQKLRINEACRVPRLFGFTMPRFGASEEDTFRNTLFKSVLLRPWSPCPGPRSRDEVAACMAVVDEDGKFERPWLTWFDVQRKLARRYEELEKRSGKIFTVHDVDMTVTYFEDVACDSGSDRSQPSAAEFMAAISVEVATNMDLNAEARAGRQPGRPEASEFEPSSLKPEGQDLEEEERVPAGGDGPEYQRDVGVDGRLDQELGKSKKPLYAFAQEDYRRIAFLEEVATNAAMSKYAAVFAEKMAPHLRKGVTHGYEKPSKVIADATVYTTFQPNLNLDDSVRAMEEKFRYKETGSKPDADEVLVGPARNRCTKHAEEPREARFVDGRPLFPAAFARDLIDDLARREKNPVTLNAEQEDFLAVVAAKMQSLVDAERGATSTVGEMQPEPGSEKPCRILLCGPGGAGKTEVVAILRRMVGHFFGRGGDVAMASSNSAARAIGGDTVHSCLHLNGKSSMQLKSLSKGVTSELCARWCDVKCLILEEISMMSPMMLAAISYRLCLARASNHAGANPALYSDAAYCFGGIPIVVMLGDFMQLAPLGEEGGRMSLLMPPRQNPGAETLGGLRLFREALTHVMFLRTTHRFVDRSVEPPRPCPILPRLLEYMRSPGGKPMPEDLWKAMKGWVVKNPGDERLKKQQERGQGFQMAIAWEAVARMMQYRAASDAAQAGEILIYVPAVDVAKTCQLSREEYRRALQVVNMTKTGKLLGMCPLFVGMRVRLNVKLSAQYKLMHDATGTVKGFEFHSEEELGWKTQDTHRARRAGHVTLEYLPRAVYVHFDGLELDLGIGAGIIPIRPTKGSWVYKAHRNSMGRRDVINVDMKRVQIPLSPEKVRTVQTAQGLSMDAATILLTRPSYMSMDDWWMHLYVMLSRVRTSAHMLVYDLPPKEMFERGPPEWVRHGLQRLEDIAAKCAPTVKQARRSIKWPDAPDRTPLAQADDERCAGPAGSMDASTISVVCGLEIEMRDAERVTELGVDVDSGDVGEMVGAAAGPLPPDGATCAEKRRQGKSARGTTSRESRPWNTARRPEASALQPPPLRNDVDMEDAERVTKLGVDSGSRDGCDMAGTAAQQETQDACRLRVETEVSAPPCQVEPDENRLYVFEALPSASAGTVREHASMQETRDMWRLCPFPSEAAESLYGAVPRDTSSGSMTPVTTSRGTGLANLGVNACFVNASVQCMLRVGPVAALLAAHVSAHQIEDHVCVACAMGRLATAIQDNTMTVSSAAAVLQHVRTGKFGADMQEQPGARGRANSYPQCDAAELLFGTGQELCLIDVLNAWEDNTLQERADVRRHVLPDVVSGSIVRSRLFCNGCSAVSDVLEREPCVKLVVGSAKQQSLPSMLDNEFKEYGTDSVCPATCGRRGPADVRKQRFLEREPAVMFFHLIRAQQNGRKINNAVEFPEVLTCMRTGAYHFASVVRHKGRASNQGHYLATCWRGSDRYTEYNDNVITDVTWQDVATKQVQGEAYVLVYVRIGFWQGVACDGTEDTPYARDEASIDASITPPVLAPAGLEGHGTARQEPTPTEIDGDAEQKDYARDDVPLVASVTPPVLASAGLEGHSTARQESTLIEIDGDAEQKGYARDEPSLVASVASVTPPVLAPAGLQGHGTARQESTLIEIDGDAERKEKKEVPCKRRASCAAPQRQEHKRQRKPPVDKGSSAVISVSRTRQPKRERGTDALSGEEVQQAQPRRSARIHARRT